VVVIVLSKVATSLVREGKGPVEPAGGSRSGRGGSEIVSEEESIVSDSCRGVDGFILKMWTGGFMGASLAITDSLEDMLSAAWRDFPFAVPVESEPTAEPP
jgi:hypothetical protein